MAAVGIAGAGPDGDCRRAAAVHPRHYRGLPERAAAAAHDSVRHIARHPASAAFVLRAAQPARAGALLHHDRGRDGGEGIFLVLVALDSDRQFRARSNSTFATICSARLVRLEPEFYVRNRTGDLMSRATNDLNDVRMVLGPGIMYTATRLPRCVLAHLFHGEAFASR